MKEKINNLLFFELLPQKLFNRFLNMADVHLIIQKKNTADVVMPSKLANILSVGGLAIVTANRDTSLYNIVKDNQIGLLCEPENKSNLSSVIENALYTDNEQIKINARNYALNLLNIDTIITDYSQKIHLL